MKIRDMYATAFLAYKQNFKWYLLFSVAIGGILSLFCYGFFYGDFLYDIGEFVCFLEYFVALAKENISYAVLDTTILILAALGRVIFSILPIEAVSVFAAFGFKTSFVQIINKIKSNAIPFIVLSILIWILNNAFMILDFIVTKYQIGIYLYASPLIGMAITLIRLMLIVVGICLLPKIMFLSNFSLVVNTLNESSIVKSLKGSLAFVEGKTIRMFFKFIPLVLPFFILNAAGYYLSNYLSSYYEMGYIGVYALRLVSLFVRPLFYLLCVIFYKNVCADSNHSVDH